jgi:hypothetical protein
LRGGARGGVLSALSLIVLFFIGCANQPTEVEKYNPEPVLSAYLYNGEPVNEVFLERVAPFNPSYNPRNSGITSATIRIFGGGDTLELTDDPAYHGRYVPASGQSLTPRGKTRYRIEARTPANEFLWAETVVPDTFGWVDIFLVDREGHRYPVGEGDTLTRDDPNMYWAWSPCDSAGGYTGSIVAQTHRDSLVPLDPEWDPETDSVEVENRTRAGFVVMRDDQHVVSIAWIFFQWEGWQRVELMAVSRDYYDYMFSTMRVDQGLIEAPITNMHGGLGIFSGMSRKSMMIYMKKVVM